MCLSIEELHIKVPQLTDVKQTGFIFISLFGYIASNGVHFIYDIHNVPFFVLQMPRIMRKVSDCLKKSNIKRECEDIGRELGIQNCLQHTYLLEILVWSLVNLLPVGKK